LNTKYSKFQLSDILENLLNVHWLRPETVLWRAIDILTMRSMDIKFKKETLDFGCGDGIFTYIYNGGCLNKNFDIYKNVTKLNKFYKNFDIYNHYNYLNSTKISHKTKKNFNIVGLDHKENLLKKAKDLNFFDNLIKADGNKKLPFVDSQFDTIFSNIVYWLNDIGGVLLELNRILKKNGNIILMLPDIKFLDSSFYYNYQIKNKIKNYEFLSLIDRERISNNVKQVKSLGEWKSLFSAAGLSVVKYKMCLSSLTLKIWDIGLRPIFPVLVKSFNKMNNKNKIEFKKDLISAAKKYIYPLLELENDAPNLQKGFYCFVLSKK